MPSGAPAASRRASGKSIPRGLSGTITKPTASAPSSAAASMSSARVIPQILTSVSATGDPDQLAQQRRAAHQRGADKHGVGARIAGGLDLGTRADARLGNAHHLARQGGDQLELAVAVDLESLQVACVDAHHPRLEAERTLHLTGVMGL